MPKAGKASNKAHKIDKCATGITGFDEITFGGLPKNRATLVCGGAGSGKSLFCMNFLYNGIARFKEPGLYVAFEESEEELIQNTASIGCDLREIIAKGKLVIDHVEFDRSEFAEVGAFNLDGLFIRLTNTIEKYKVKRVVLDTVEVLFGNLKDQSMLRSELQRLFRWFKRKNITVLVTSETASSTFSRYGLEEYVADCVILLDNRTHQQISTRRLRISKYRGSPHGANEYPFVITNQGIIVTDITSILLNYSVSTKKISSGVPQLDTMLNGVGFFRGSSILVTGPSGIGKSSFCAAFANKTCQDGERCYYFAFEESYDQITRNMESIGMNLKQWIKKDLLRFHATNPHSNGLESHIVTIQNAINAFKPSVVIIDPISNLKSVAEIGEVQDMMSLLIDYLKSRHITMMFTSLTDGSTSVEYSKTNEGISSSMDTWIHLQYIYGEGERNRGLGILKSRGMAHSNQMREIILSKKGIQLEQVYMGEDRVLAGSGRIIQDAKSKIEKAKHEFEFKQKLRQLEISRKELQSQMGQLHEMLAANEEELNLLKTQNEFVHKVSAVNRAKIAEIRMADRDANNHKKAPKGRRYAKAGKSQKK